MKVPSMTNGQLRANIVLVSNVIFSSKEDKPFAGFIAINDNKIIAVGDQSEQNKWIGPETKVYRLGDQQIMPGIHDNHVFFTGYMSMNRGVDLSKMSTVDEAITLLIKQSESLGPSENLYAFGWDKESLGCIPEQNRLDEVFPAFIS
jgi:predicted amidohydrolase YtcJ